MRALLLSSLLLLACAPPPDAEKTPAAAPAIEIGTQLGQRAPDFTLPTSAGGEFALSKRDDGPLIVVFFRGVW